MRSITVQTSAPTVNRECTVKLNEWPETVAEAVQLWGEEAVFSAINKSAVISLQASIRRRMEDEDDGATFTRNGAQKFANEWKLKTRGKVDNVKKAATLVRKLSDEEKEAVLREMGIDIPLKK